MCATVHTCVHIFLLHPHGHWSAFVFIGSTTMSLQADSTAIVSNKCQRKLSKRWSLIFYSLPTSNKHQWTITSIQFICSSFAVVWLPKWLPHVMHQAVPHPEDRRRLLQISKQVGAGPLKVDPFECPSKDFREFGWIWTDYRLYYHRYYIYIYIHTL